MIGALLLAGCQTTAMVRVDVNSDGSGSVAVDVYLDAEAAAQVGDLSKIVAVDDLRKAGWKVTGPAPPAKVRAALAPAEHSSRSGMAKATVQIHLEHPFANTDEANEILSNLSGPDGPFTDVAISRHSSLFRTDLRFTGKVDLSKGLDTFTDADLTKVLGGPLSDTVAASGTEKPSGDDLTIGLQIEPSGGLDWSGQMGNASQGSETPSVATELGAAPHSLDVHASQVRWTAVIAAAVIIGLSLVGLVVVGLRLRRRANRAERALLPAIEVSDPFVGSDEAVDQPADAHSGNAGDGTTTAESGPDSADGRDSRADQAITDPPTADPPIADPPSAGPSGTEPSGVGPQDAEPLDGPGIP